MANSIAVRKHPAINTINSYKLNTRVHQSVSVSSLFQEEGKALHFCSISLALLTLPLGLPCGFCKGYCTELWNAFLCTCFDKLHLSSILLPVRCQSVILCSPPAGHSATQILGGLHGNNFQSISSTIQCSKGKFTYIISVILRTALW